MLNNRQSCTVANWIEQRGMVNSLSQCFAADAVFTGNSGFCPPAVMYINLMSWGYVKLKIPLIAADD